MIVPNTPLEVLLTIRDDDHPDGYKLRLPVVAVADDMAPYVAVYEGFVKSLEPGVHLASAVGEIQSVHPKRIPAKVVQFLPLAVEAIAVWEVVDGLFRSEQILGQYLMDDGSTEPVTLAHDGTFTNAYEVGADAVVTVCTSHTATVEAELHDGRKIKVVSPGDGEEPTITLV